MPKPRNRKIRSRKTVQRVLPKHPTSKETGQITAAASLQGPAETAPRAIVGIGASAGGLKAFEQFFATMPPDSGVGFVLVSHRDPNHVSLLPDLLKKYTKMDIVLAEDGMQVAPNVIYLAQPNREIIISEGKVSLREPTERPGFLLPIDTFLRALAKDQKERAIGIVLSGNGGDGTLGLKEVNAEGGLTLAQEPTSAEYSSMPRTAIQSGAVDFALPPDKMPAEIVNYVRHAYIKGHAQSASLTVPSTEALLEICSLLRTQTGHDFSHYKHNTICRRIERRMSVHQIENVADYLHLLQQTPQEITVLFKELLIGVTNFFRDPDAFEALTRHLIREMLPAKPKDYTFRVWVPGCATGEEAYSIAILLRECADKLKRNLAVQIFATDIDRDAIDAARSGLFPASIAADVTGERLLRFFTRENSHYRIKKEIREMVVFAVHDLIKDPPFTRLDLLNCRNLLIYFDGALQQKLLPLFHYALKPDGLLFLGSSESIGAGANLFALVDKKYKLFRPKGSRFVPDALIRFGGETGSAAAVENVRRTQPVAEKEIIFSKLAEKMLLDEYAPPSVLISADGDILFAHGHTGKYLELAQGRASLNILEMAKEGIRHTLGTLIRQAQTRKKQVSVSGLQVRINGEYQSLNLTVKPLRQIRAAAHLMIIAFEDASPKPSRSRKAKSKSPPKAAQRILHLEQELRYNREQLQATIEELEIANQDLKSSNEELQSTNEELQSANEELETSKEELQSLNEELVTVNAELQGKIDELSDTNDDMRNLLDATKIATIFLDQRLCIKRFTPETTKIVHLIPSDIGRPISHIVTDLEDSDLEGAARAVLDSLMPQEREVRSRDGSWYQMRLLPYRTLANVIDGVVVTLADITLDLKRPEALAQQARQYAENIVDTVREAMLVLDDAGNVRSANRAFYRLFEAVPETTLGRSLYTLANGQWDIPVLREMLERTLPKNGSFEDLAVEQQFAGVGRKKLKINARRLPGGGAEGNNILLAIEDVTAI